MLCGRLLVSVLSFCVSLFFGHVYMSLASLAIYQSSVYLGAVYMILAIYQSFVYLGAVYVILAIARLYINHLST